MPEPTTSAGLSISAGIAGTGVITAMGVSLGLRVDILIAGFLGALVAMTFFNTVPSSGDTFPHLIRTTLRRMAFAFASSLTAGYLTPLAMLLATLPESVILGGAFAVGGGAQKVLLFAIHRVSGNPQSTEAAK